jgi:hypothetical protein
MTMTRFAFTCLLLVVSAGAAGSQTPAAPPPPPVEVVAFKSEAAEAPGGGSWLRLFAAFRSSPAWADGLAFYYDVLVEKGGQFRVLAGTARYSNVKAGSHLAVLFMSPSAVARFGAPVAAQVGVGYNDELMDSFQWTADGADVSADWATKYERYADQLQPIYLTPFVATEYGRYPDAMVVR